MVKEEQVEFVNWNDANEGINWEFFSNAKDSIDMLLKVNSHTE